MCVCVCLCACVCLYVLVYVLSFSLHHKKKTRTHVQSTNIYTYNHLQTGSLSLLISFSLTLSQAYPTLKNVVVKEGELGLFEFTERESSIFGIVGGTLFLVSTLSRTLFREGGPEVEDEGFVGPGVDVGGKSRIGGDFGGKKRGATCNHVGFGNVFAGCAFVCVLLSAF